VLNILTENSCLFVVIPYIFSLCRSLSAVAPALHSTQCGGGLAKVEATDYAKQSQFAGYSNERKLLS